jgi:hypothetical protein
MGVQRAPVLWADGARHQRNDGLGSVVAVTWAKSPIPPSEG